MSPDKRVYDVAKEFNITTKELIEKLEKIDIKVKSHSSTLTSFQIARLKELFNANNDGDKKSSRPKAFVVKKVKKNDEENKENKSDKEVEEKEKTLSSQKKEEIKIEEKKEIKERKDLTFVNFCLCVKG